MFPHQIIYPKSIGPSKYFSLNSHQNFIGHCCGFLYFLYRAGSQIFKSQKLTSHRPLCHQFEEQEEPGQFHHFAEHLLAELSKKF